MFFFFQAEDGIRDRTVTGVQTCALPILRCTPASISWAVVRSTGARRRLRSRRSEERRVGKECRSRWSPEHEKKKTKVHRYDTARQHDEVDCGAADRRVMGW